VSESNDSDEAKSEDADIEETSQDDEVAVVEDDVSTDDEVAVVEDDKSADDEADSVSDGEDEEQS